MKLFLVQKRGRGSLTVVKMAASFVPKDREELLLRTPLTFGFSEPNNMYQSHTHRETVSRDGFSATRSGSREQQRAKIKKISRNTPHTGRVRQMKGLTNDPICSVEDNLTRPRPMSALTDRDLGSGYIPPGSSRYSANVNKQLFAVGVVPITFAWRDELLRKAEKAICIALGQDKHPGRPLSRQSTRGEPKQFEHLEDKALLDMLCGILHTDSIPRCQDWLNNAPEDQKDIVMNMIRVAVLGETQEDLPTRPPSSYVWRPPTRQLQQQSRSQRRYSDPLLGDSLDLLSLNTHPRYLFASHQPDTVTAARERGAPLPKIGQTPQDKELMKTNRSTQKGKGRLKRSESYDPSTNQMDELEKDVYKTIATGTVVNNSQRKEKRHASDRKQKQKKDGVNLTTESGDTFLPPLTNTRQPTINKQQHGRPRSKSLGSGQEAREKGSGIEAGYSYKESSGDHRAFGNRRSREDSIGSKMKHTSHYNK